MTIIQADQVEQQETRRRVPWSLVAASVVAVVVSLITYVRLLDRVAGAWVDDGWYILLAKALASGQGYTPINSPSPGILPFYPPGFPLLLSIVFRLAPAFPENVPLLKSVSIAAMMGFGILAYIYIVHNRGFPHLVGLGVAVATVLNPLLVFFTTSTVMSEPVFALSQLLTILVFEKWIRNGEKGHAALYGLLCSALASFVFLTRSIGLALIISLVVYSVRERLYRTAVIIALGVILMAGPWVMISVVNAPTAQQRIEQGGQIVYSYADQFWMRVAGFPSYGTISPSELPARVGAQVWQIFRTSTASMVVSSLYWFLWWRVSWLAALLSIALTSLAAIGFIAIVRTKVSVTEVVTLSSLVMILLWPWEATRFLLPLLPFVIIYILVGAHSVLRLLPRLHRISISHIRSIISGVILISIVALDLYGNAGYNLWVFCSPMGRLGWVRGWEENVEMFKWIRETLPQEQVLATTNPPLVYLYTGHKTVYRETIEETTANRNNLSVRYLVLSSRCRFGDPTALESKYATPYGSTSLLNLRVIDVGLK